MERQKKTFADYIDGSFVINLDERKDRWEEVQEKLRSFLPGEKYERLSAVHGKALPGYGEAPWFRGRKKDFRWAGRAGCTLSHRKAMKEGLKREWKTFLILEDDLEISDGGLECLNELSTHLFEEDFKWDMCYLGFSTPRGPAKTLGIINHGFRFCQLRGARTTHAYLIKAPLARWLLECLPSEKDIWEWCSRKRVVDRWYSRNICSRFSVTCVSPSIFIQAPSYSDLVGRVGENWEESAVVSHLPDAMLDPSFFSLRWCLSGLKCRINNAFDWLKGFVKRFSGF